MMPVGKTNEDEEKIAQFFFDIGHFLKFVTCFELFGPFGITDGACEFAEFFGKPGKLDKGRKIALFKLCNPTIHASLRFGKSKRYIFWKFIIHNTKNFYKSL